MPNDNTLEDDFREIAREEADKNRVVSVGNLPEVQKVEVTNPPEPTKEQEAHLGTLLPL